MNIPEIEPKEWSEAIEHWLHHVSDSLGVKVGFIVVIMAVAWYALKLIKVWRGK